MRRAALVPLLFLLAAPAAARAQDPADEVAAVAVEILEAISEPDTAALRRLMMPEAVTIAVIDQAGTVRYVVRSTEEVVVGIGGETANFVERGWDPVVEVQGPLATVWLPYDFYIDGAFSHCGVDAFQFIRTGDGWRVAALTYTVEQPPACERHPDGPPGV